VENPCATVWSAGFICLELSERGKPLVCATCTADGCLCIDPGAVVAAVVAEIAAFVAPKDFTAPEIRINPGRGGY
jgi:hypothetical protein